MKDLLLVGGGHSHAIVLDLWRRQPLPGVRLTLVSDGEKSIYSGMVPGYVAGNYREDECKIDLARLCVEAGAQFFQGEATGLDLTHQRVILKDGGTVPYDILSLASGSRPALATIPGAAQFTVPVKPLAGFLQTWNSLLAQAASSEMPLRLLVVGGGAGGVEIALAMKHRLSEKSSVTLIERASQLLSDHCEAARRAAAKALLKAGVELRLDASPGEFKEGLALLENDEEISFDAAFLITGAEAPLWVKSSGLATDERGFINVDAALRSVSHPNVFASGDLAHMVNYTRPKSGVYAVRQGLPLFTNLRRTLANKPPVPYHPQVRALNLIGTGPRRAILSWGSFAMESGVFWTLKESIDRRFMRRFGN